MSKDPTQSRIPRIGSSSTTTTSRIPVPGSVRPLQTRFHHSKLAKPSSIPSVPVTPFLRPTRSSAVSIARSYSGDKLCGELTPLPALAASTPAPALKPTHPSGGGLEFYRKLELASNENLHDTFAVPSSSPANHQEAPPADYSYDGLMLVDESLELVRADSIDNISLADHPNGINAMKPASSNETVTLNCDGNVTYEVKRSETFVKTSQESLKLGGSRESLNRTRGASLFQSSSSKSSGESPILDKTHTLLIDVGEGRGEGAFSSTMVSDRPMNVTQNIPNVTADREAMPHINRQSLLYHTHEVHSPDRLLPAEPMAPQRPTRLTFNLNETTDLLHISDPVAVLNKTQVFSSTMHSPMAVGSIDGILNVTRDIQGSGLVGLSLDTSAGERTLTAEEFAETMDVDDGGAGKEIFDMSLDEPPSVGREDVPIRAVEGRSSIPAKQRYSFGLDLTEYTLDCSIELCDSSISSAKPHIKSPVSNSLTKQSSFEMDESLGILTPDQMKEFLDSTTTNTNNTNNLELQLNTGSHKHGLHHCRIDQTPSPEELPLDPVGVKTDMSDIILPSEILSNAGPIMYQEISQTDSDSKTDQMTKSATSKVSNSFITSITSITSLDTGYQGDGEMSRPASRGADHSPSNGPKIKNQAAGVWNAPAAQPAPVPRRPDPMTDSDFFTESDADDVFNRGDRRAQIIDGQLYGPMLQGANVFINQQPQNDDSCMESSGIFTDVENRGEDDLVHRRSENEDQVDRDEVDHGVGQLVADSSDMSPDVSTDTISSSNTACSLKKVVPTNVAESIEAGANCLRNASMALSAAQVDGPQPESDVTSKHGVTPSLSGGAANTTTLHQIQPSPSASSLVSVADSRIDSDNGVAAVGIGASHKAESATNITISRAGPTASSSTDSLSGAPVGSGGISSVGSSNNGCGKKPGSSRKQQKNETNLVLKKHEMTSRAVKTRLFKESAVAKSASRSVGGSALNLDVENECENQENKRPTSANRGGVGGPRGASGSVGNLSFTKKSATPNKWDAVMSKIAENKAVIKKNFSDVKSKISCGKTVVSTSSSSLVVGAAGRRLDSPASLKSPPSECSSVGNRSIGAIPMTGAAGGKRTISGSVKRRTHSKDSQQSSQSDISLTGGSPKLQPKASSIRPAKKRDVRTINSSSSDLGPPSKTVGGNVNPIGPQQQQQQQHQRASLRMSATLQKRISSPASVTNASIVPEQLKGSPPPKRNLIAKRTLSAASAGSNNSFTTNTITTTTTGGAHVVKTPLKDHNRLVGPTPNAKQQQPGVNSPKVQTKSLIRSHPSVASPTTTTTTPSCPKNNHNNNNINNNNITSNGTSLKNAANIQRNGTIILEKAGSPLILGGGDGRCTGPGPAVGGGHPGKQKIGSETALAPGGVGGNKADSLRNNNLVDISLLNHANRGVEALGVLVQYLVFNLDAFSCPTIKKSHQKTTHDLLETKSMLDGERSTCQSLKQQLLENTEREAELQELHRCELSKVEACLSEQQRSAADRTTALEAELLRKELEADDKLRSATEQYESRLAEQEAELKQSHVREQELLQRINALSCTENELREKVHSSELEFSERLQAAALRERDLTEQLKHLNRQMEEMRRAADARQLELEEKVSLTQDECNFLRHHGRVSLEPQAQDESRDTSRTSLGAASIASELSFTGAPLQTNRSSGNLSPAQVLQDEVNSLRCVLDLKQREISDLRKLTQEYERDAKELPSTLVKISALESRIEDLQVQLKTKTEEEKDLQQKLKLLQDNLKQETKTKTRLSQHNEELQWKLKQNSEKFSHVYAELSKSYHENSSFMNATRLSLDQAATSAIALHHHQLNHSRSSGGSERVFEMDDLSPPTSPVIKGVVEKSDSVSWVLEMDDEPPEISASRMVRRAGSFRSSVATGASQDVVKRQRCFNNSLNGIQQSSSVGSILKQQDVSPSKTVAAPGTPRLRSKSVSIKAATEPPKKIVRSNSGASSSAVSKPIRMADMPHSWKDPPLYSSSPYAHKRFLNERMENGGVSKSFREGKDLFLEETEFLGDMGGESPFSRSRVGSFGEGPAEGASEQPVEFFHRDKTPNFKKSKENRGLITCDTTALTESGGDTPAHKKRREFARKNLAGKSNSLPKEAAGEALVSGSNSDDEASSSSCLSDDLSSGGSSTSSGSSSSSSSSSSCTGGASSCGSRSSGEGRQALVELDESGQVNNGSIGGSGERRRRRSSNISIEDALIQKIVASLNGTIANEGNETPMEVSWSEDGDPSESIV